jgi:hypothetical protein
MHQTRQQIKSQKAEGSKKPNTGIDVVKTGPQDKGAELVAETGEIRGQGFSLGYEGAHNGHQGQEEQEEDG